MPSETVLIIEMKLTIRDVKFDVNENILFVLCAVIEGRAYTKFISFEYAIVHSFNISPKPTDVNVLNANFKHERLQISDLLLSHHRAYLRLKRTNLIETNVHDAVSNLTDFAKIQIC